MDIPDVRTNLAYFPGGLSERHIYRILLSPSPFCRALGVDPEHIRDAALFRPF